MSQQLFNWGIGAKDDNNVSFLSGAGAPSFASQYWYEAALGSKYVDTTNGNVYYKIVNSSPPAASDWELFDPSQIDVIQNFIGQDTNTQEWPEYPSPLYNVSEGSPDGSLRDGIYDLDQALGDPSWTALDRSDSPTLFQIVPANSIQMNLEAIDKNIGADSDMSSPITYIDPNVSIYANLDALDAAIGNNTWTQNTRSSSPTQFELDPSQSVHYNLEILDDVIGADAEMTSQNYIDPNVSIYSNLSALDAAVAAGGITQVQVDNVTTITTIDSVAVTEVAAAKWFVTAISDADSTNREAVEVYAMNNGDDDVDYNIYSLLKIGPDISGLTLSVDVDTVASPNVMRLRVASTQQVDVKAARVQVVVA